MLRGFLSALRGRVQSSSPLELLREKRRVPRRPSQQQLIVRSRGQAFPARCLDQSSGGVRFECSANETIKAGDSLELSSTERALRLNGRVAWVKSVQGRKQVGVRRDGALDPAAPERRQYVRLSPPLLATSQGRRLKVLDVGLRGLRVESDERLQGQEITLDLHLPGPPMSIQARVLESGRVSRLSIPTLEEASQQRLGQFLAGLLKSGI